MRNTAAIGPWHSGYSFRRFWLLGIAGVGDLGGVLRADVLFVGFLRFASPGNPPIFNWAQP